MMSLILIRNLSDMLCENVRKRTSMVNCLSFGEHGGSLHIGTFLSSDFLMVLKVSYIVFCNAYGTETLLMQK